MDPILQGMMTGRLNEFAQGTRAIQRQAANNIAHAQGIIDRQHDEIVELQNRIDCLSKVREAEDEALAATTAAWRKEHPVSHMHDIVGKFSDGHDMRRNFVIWANAFDAAASHKGIRNPLAYRIS